MSEKFTKGPWYLKDEGEYGIVIQADKYPIAIMVDFAKENEVNANLIAAAPDMYEALEVFCSYCFGCTDNECKICIYGKALRKARGETE